MGGIVRITDKMLYTAAVACADSMTEQSYAEGRTFPKIQDIREGKQLYMFAVYLYYCWRCVVGGSTVRCATRLGPSNW